MKKFPLTRLLAGIVLTLLIMQASTFAQGDPNKPIKVLNFQDADIRSVMNFLAEYGDVNIVTSPTVEGNVSITLKNVTWQLALDILMKTYGLTAVQERGYIRVVPTKEYLEETSMVQRHRSEQAKIVALETEIISVDNASAYDLVDPIQTILTERGKVEVDKRSNSLIVNEIPENIDLIKEFVRELDQETAQIKISAQLVEVSSQALSEIGIDWSVRGSKEVRKSSGYEADYDHTTGVNADDVSDPVGEFIFSTAQPGWELDAALRALVSDGNGKIVAHPEVITVDNKEATIQSGQKIPIKTFDPSGNVVITFEEVGTILRVTPHITSENRILLHLKPERSTYEFDPNGVIINTNNAETNVVVENGQTVVIGGLTTQDVVKNHIGVPVLKDIPLLGHLFGYTKKRVENRDLVIFVTPTVVGADLAAVPGRLGHEQ
ncbi:MAG: type IV pilus secretin PilQ [candidate division Zixibacteria bacterium]|jgi:type IV pilus secretin PilQ/predicted competence protein|nr:type IV pilus secretin PilQ [candidate division Zixibacteria bacterium]